MENNERAKERTESIVVVYVKGVSEKLRKDLANEDVNLVFKIGWPCTQWFSMENTKRLTGERKTSSTKSLARIANYAILEKQRNGMMKGKSSIRGVFVIKMTTTHYSDTSRCQAMILIVCRERWGNEPKRRNAEGHLLEHHYPNTKQNLVQITFIQTLTSQPYQQGLVQLDKLLKG